MTPTIGARARRTIESLAMKVQEARSDLDNEIFDALRAHAMPIREAIESAVITASSEGRCECSMGYDGISLRDYKAPAPSQRDIDRNGAVLEIRAWAITEGLRVNTVIEEAPEGAIGFYAMKFPRFRFDVSWPEENCARQNA